jgi:hypothetical protein
LHNVPQRPATLLAATVVQAAEAIGLLAAAIVVGIDTASGHAYQFVSGVALTLIALAVAAALGLVALGLNRERPWSRTPAVLTQLFIGVVAVYLIQGHRYAWGAPMAVLAVCALAMLFAPATLRALVRERKSG